MAEAFITIKTKSVMSDIIFQSVVAGSGFADNRTKKQGSQLDFLTFAPTVDYLTIGGNFFSI